MLYCFFCLVPLEGFGWICAFHPIMLRADTQDGVLCHSCSFIRFSFIAQSGVIFHCCWSRTGQKQKASCLLILRSCMAVSDASLHRAHYSYSGFCNFCKQSDRTNGVCGKLQGQRNACAAIIPVFFPPGGVRRNTGRYDTVKS